MITNPNTSPRYQTLRGAKGPLAFVRVLNVAAPINPLFVGLKTAPRTLRVTAPIKPEDTRVVYADSDGNLFTNSKGDFLRSY